MNLLTRATSLHLVSRLVFFLVSFLVFFTSTIAAAPLQAPSAKPNQLVAQQTTQSTQLQYDSTLVQISSPSWLIQHWPAHGKPRTLAQKNAEIPAHPASLTKLVAAYVCLKAIQQGETALDQFITISEQATQQEGMRVGYTAAERVSLKDAIQGMLAISGNDAAWALAEHLGPGSAAFVTKMNAYSKTLGLSQSQWQNPHGLTQAEHLSSAKDIVTVSEALWREFPAARPWFANKTYTWNGLTQSNRNSLLWRSTAFDGLKTGHTEAAGYNLAATSHAPVKLETDEFDWRITTVLMGAASTKIRADESAALHQWARTQFAPWRTHTAGQQLGHIRIAGALEPTPLHTEDALWVLLQRQQNPQQLQYELSPLPGVSAPVRKGEALASLNVYLDGTLISSTPALASVQQDKATALERVWHWVKSLFKS